jgi:magnesium-transporting ATPase (P-type)
MKQVTSNLGLSSAEAEARLKQHGLNVLPTKPPVTLWRRFLNQFRSPLIYILIFALAIDLTIWLVEGHSALPVESFAIGLILLLNAGLGVYQESKAETALTRLKALAESFVWVLRDGHLVHLPSAQLALGDVARIEAGDRVPADGTLVESQGIAVDESVLTGESLPVEKGLKDEVLSGTLLLFLYMSIGQLVFAYPARHIATASRRNIALPIAVVLGIVLQLLTIYVPALRHLLGLALPQPSGLIWVAGAVLLSWGVAETFGWWSNAATRKAPHFQPT